MKLITEYVSYENDRKAIIYEDQYHWVISMYKGEKVWHTELISGKALCYAEDCAENFVMKYGAFKDEV